MNNISNLHNSTTEAVNTGCNLTEPPLFDSVVLPSLHFTIFIIGVFGNGLVLLVVGKSVFKRNKYGNKTSVTNVLVFNLALADLIFIGTLPFHAIEKIKNRLVWIEFLF